MEEHKEKNLPLLPTDSVNILPSPASQSQPKTPEAPNTKATLSLLILQNFRKLVATVQNFATTSKTLAVAYIAWHSGWFSGLEHPNLGIPASSASSSSLQRPKEVVWGEHSLPHFLISFFLGLFYFIVFYFDFYNFAF